ncbi:MAG: hypothetical protein HXY46_12180 [Syntrophaceae bacterium]|nr:hypothetical protein [Syntrophaceae bacterium]
MTAAHQCVIQIRIDGYSKGTSSYSDGCNYSLGGKVYNGDLTGPCACHYGLIGKRIDGKTPWVSFKGNILGIGL